MTPRAARILVGLGVPAALLGGWILQDHYRFNRDLVPAIAVGGGATLLLALGLGRLRGRVVGAIVLAGGAAVIAGTVVMGQRNEDALRRQIHRELEVMKAAEAVCQGTPNAAAAPVTGKRAVMQVVTRVGESNKPLSIATTWDGLPAPATVAELGLVVCRNETKDFVTRCDYDDTPREAGERRAGSFTIMKYRVTDRLELRDARTAAVIATQTFQGGAPSDRCDEVVHVERGVSSHTTTGDAPDHDAETAFIREHLAPAER